MPTIRFLILSDTHDDAFPPLEDLAHNKVDVVLHCGDLTMIGGLSNYRKTIEIINAIPAKLRLVIPGNHDVSLDPVWWAKNLLDDEDDAKEVDKALELFADAGPSRTDGDGQGIILLSEGVHKFTLKNGASFSIYASPYTPEFGGYAFSYGPGEDRFNGEGKGRIPDLVDGGEGVDIVMTHGPPAFNRSSLETKYHGKYKLDLGREGDHCGCEKLFRAIERSRPLVHCFGHIHEGYGVQKVDWEAREIRNLETSEKGISVPATTRGKETLIVNAAVQRHGEGTMNEPCIVDLEL